MSGNGQLRTRVIDTLEGAFHASSVNTDDGWHGRLHVRIVSPDFNGQSEREKQRRVWEVLRRQLAADAQNIALVLAYGEDETEDEEDT